MSKINLLPWRQELKNIRNKNFFVILGFSVFLTILLIILCDFMITYETQVQYANAGYISNELEKVKSQVREIDRLKENKKQLLERFWIINALQIDRPSIVKLLDMLPRVLPESVYLTLLARKEMEPLNTDNVNSSGKSEITALKHTTLQDSNMAQSGTERKKYLVTAEGVALTNGSISMFLKQLEEIKWLTDIKLQEVSINKDKTGLIFKLEFVQNLS